MYRNSSKERPGRSFKSQPSRGGAHLRGRSFANLRFISFASLFYFVDKGTQSFTIVVSKHTAQTGHMKKQDTQGKERVKKPYENEKVTKNIKEKTTKQYQFRSLHLYL